jgi:hypothetical protein
MDLGVRRFRQKLATVSYDCLARGFPGTGMRPALRTTSEGGVLAKAPGLSGNVTGTGEFLYQARQDRNDD